MDKAHEIENNTGAPKLLLVAILIEADVVLAVPDHHWSTRVPFDQADYLAPRWGEMVFGR